MSPRKTYTLLEFPTDNDRSPEVEWKNVEATLTTEDHEKFMQWIEGQRVGLTGPFVWDLALWIKAHNNGDDSPMPY